MNAVLLAHAAATVGMAGVAWFVNVVHYPLFALVAGDFARYEKIHADRTTVVVAPLMTVEAATALVLVAWKPGWLTGAGLALVAVLWLSTAFIQVPCHRALGRGFDAGVHRRLVRTSWIRTAGWTGRSAIALSLLLSHAT